MVNATAAPDLAEEFDASSSSGILPKIQVVLHKYPYLSPLTVLIVAMIIFTLLNDRFILATNLSLMTQQTVIVGTLAIAQTLIILTAGIDLSIGAIMVFAQMTMANLVVTSDVSNVAGFGWPAPLAIAAGILIAVVAGAVNGFLIVRFKLPPFIVTLGTLSVFTALSLIFFKARTIQGPEMPDMMTWMGTAFEVGPFRVMTGVLVMLGLYALFAYILRNTSWGTHIYAVGDDRDAAELSGINTGRVLFSVYAVAGLVMGIAAWITIGRVGSASPNVAPNINLDSITAVVIGGTSLFGGRGIMIGTLLGALIVTVVENGLALAGLDQAYRVLAVGVLVITAVALDQWIRKVKA
ncbi:ABC transporter permease [Ilumatobacter sp.]|uniref:ABC transporter permease n=1 Tax=Ilumatobacter sp. TaxID=1967498 RepID=UPI003AF54C2E